MSTSEISSLEHIKIKAINDAAAALQALAEAANQRESVTEQVEVFNSRLAILKEALSVTADADAHMAILECGKFTKEGHNEIYSLRLAFLLASEREELGTIKQSIRNAANRLKEQRIKVLKQVYENIDAAIAVAPLPAGEGPYSDYFLGMEGAKKTDEDITPTLDELSRENQFPSEGVMGEMIRPDHPLIADYAKYYPDLESILKILGEPNTTMAILDLMGPDFKLDSLERHYHRCAQRTSPIMGSVLTGVARTWAMKREGDQNKKDLKDRLLESKNLTEFASVIQQSSDEEKEDFTLAQRFYVVTELIKSDNKLGELRLLLESNLYNVTYQNRATQKSALHFAVEAGNQEAIAYLIKKGADIFAQDRMQQTPLTLIFEKNNPEAILNTILDGLEKRLNVKEDKYAKKHINALRKEIKKGSIKKGNVHEKFFHVMYALEPEQRLNYLRRLTKKRIEGFNGLTAHITELNETTEEKVSLKLKKLNTYNLIDKILSGEDTYHLFVEGKKTDSTSRNIEMGGKKPSTMSASERLNSASSLLNSEDNKDFSEHRNKKVVKAMSIAKAAFLGFVKSVFGERFLKNRMSAEPLSQSEVYKRTFNAVWPRSAIEKQNQLAVCQPPTIKSYASSKKVMQAAINQGVFNNHAGEIEKKILNNAAKKVILEAAKTVHGFALRP